MKTRRFIILGGPVLILLFAVIYVSIRSFFSTGNGPILVEYPDSLKIPPVIIREYGLPVDSFIIHTGIIQKDQSLSDLLMQYGVSRRDLHEIVTVHQDVFDFRKIRYGKPYKLFCARDTSQELQYFVYEHTPVEYVLVGIKDSIVVSRSEKEVKIEEHLAGAKIRSSLWMTMKENNLDPMMAIELSEMFAWNIDFFGIREGDFFKVVYNRHYVDTQYIGLGEIHGAYFYHAGKDFYAIPFVQDSVRTFFDQDGNSLRRAFLKAPLRYSRISSRYSWSRMHPILKILRPHLGVDYAAPVGTPVLAIGDGRIIEKSYKQAAGYMLKIRHNSVYTTAYLHLGSYGKGVQTGAYVRQGDVIGYVGSTGLSTGPHLDFRFYKNGSPIDPLKIKAPPVEPVNEENLVGFDSVKTIVMSRLEQIAVQY
jgi:murein DD-endopeptidase MepM/ murein hydrolase activator NlpD